MSMSGGPGKRQFQPGEVGLWQDVYQGKREGGLLVFISAGAELFQRHGSPCKEKRC